MIDIHCHIVPGIDDGAKNIEDALEMARKAECDGIKKIINTSHFSNQFDYTFGNQLQEELDKFNDLLKKKDIDIEILIGNELYYDSSMLEYIGEKKFFTMNNSRYILIEFPLFNFPTKLSEVVYEFRIRGYIPILAHIEIYIETQKNPSLINEAIKEGALIQVNASSILGKGSFGSQRLSKFLLKNSLVHFIGSDAHGSQYRQSRLKKSYDYVLDKYGEAMAHKLFLENPNKVLHDEEINFTAEVKDNIQKKSFFLNIFKRK